LLYTKYYPELYVKAPDSFTCESKTVYLTFDDGPSQNTLDILKILDKHKIKATFFMCGSKTEEGKDIMKKVADAGHTIGVHSYLHDITLFITALRITLTILTIHISLFMTQQALSRQFSDSRWKHKRYNRLCLQADYCRNDKARLCLL
jgi:peptidoglycan/xylan/chitin deacetylase (PgdA/CDA1 family)